MIKFDPSLLYVEIVQLKSVTTALGGSISILDEAKSFGRKEVQRRIAVPMSVAQSFIKKTQKRTKYLKPTLTALVRYDGMVIAMERHPLSSMGELVSDGLFGPTRWVPDCESSIEQIVKPLVRRGDNQWYFDGRYIYAFNYSDPTVAVREGEYLTHDGAFRKVVAQSLDAQDLSDKTKVHVTHRSCIAFVTSRGTGVISPPIWKNISDVGTTQINKASRTDEDEDEDESTSVADTSSMYSFDAIDETLSVNLNFALKAGKEIGRLFGYEHVEPLRLPQLMVELCTVNLPNIPNTIKATYDIGIDFTHAVSWLLGLSRKADTLKNYMVIRSLLKQLTKKGIFRKNVFNHDRIFKSDMTVTNVPLKSLNTLVREQDVAQLSLSALLANGRTGRVKRTESTDILSIGNSMMSDE